MVVFVELLDRQEGLRVLTPRRIAAPKCRSVLQLRAGFSLVELLVAITLLGLLTTLSLPSFLGWIKNTQVRTVAEALQNGLRVAQTEALRRSTAVAFYRTNTPLTAANTGAAPPNIPFAAGGVNWVVVNVPQFGGTSSDVVFLQGGSLGSTASATNLTGPDSLCFDAGGRLVFTPTTLPSGASCAITSPATFSASQPSPADRELRVTVSGGGKVRMCDPRRVLSAATPDGC